MKKYQGYSILDGIPDNRNNEYTTNDSITPEKESEYKCIMVVDDEVGTTTFLAELLASSGY